MYNNIEKQCGSPFLRPTFKIMTCLPENETECDAEQEGLDFCLKSLNHDEMG